MQCYFDPTLRICCQKRAMQWLSCSMSLRDQIRIVIFEAETYWGRFFDVVLILCILASIGAVFLDTIAVVHLDWGVWLYRIEWFFTILFTVEYALRLWCINNTRLYATSFYGIVDLLGILPTFLSLIFPGAQHLLVIRVLRVLRVFRVFRLVRYVGEADQLISALLASRRKITVFICTVLTMVVVFGSLMYLIEGGANGFTSIPRSIYWAIVTLTTVGYGDLTPHTVLGQIVASLVMIMGYGVIAVPTGIITLELGEAARRRANTHTCPECSAEGHREEASFCWRCGNALYRAKSEEMPPLERL